MSVSSKKDAPHAIGGSSFSDITTIGKSSKQGVAMDKRLKIFPLMPIAPFDYDLKPYAVFDFAAGEEIGIVLET